MSHNQVHHKNLLVRRKHKVSTVQYVEILFSPIVIDILLFYLVRLQWG